MDERTRTAAWALMLAMIAGTTGLREAYAGPLGLAVLTAGPAMRSQDSSRSLIAVAGLTVTQECR